MENLDENIDLKVTKGLRNEFLCKRCDIFPRPDTKLMRCSSCTKLLCQNCSERYSQPRDKKKREMRDMCPFCHYQSKDQKKKLIDLIISQLRLKKESHHLELGDTGITPNLSSTGG